MKTTSRMLGLLALGLAAAANAAPNYINTTAGGTLRPGVYGRIEIGKSPPPPLIYEQPVIASGLAAARGLKPVYLYVPPGQARKWARHCGKYHACELPVFFVRVENSPSRLGSWKSRAPDPNRHAGVLSAMR